MATCPYCDENGKVVVQASASAIGAEHTEPCRICGGRAKPAGWVRPADADLYRGTKIHYAKLITEEPYRAVATGTHIGRGPIPPMDHPLSKHWSQPPLEQIDLTPTEARMTAATMAKLAVYDSTLPSGVYPGKMWLRNQPIPQTDKTVPLLCWYAADGPDHCRVENVNIVLVDKL